MLPCCPSSPIHWHASRNHVLAAIVGLQLAVALVIMLSVFGLDVPYVPFTQLHCCNEFATFEIAACNVL